MEKAVVAGYPTGFFSSKLYENVSANMQINGSRYSAYKAMILYKIYSTAETANFAFDACYSLYKKDPQNLGFLEKAASYMSAALEELPNESRGFIKMEEKRQASFSEIIWNLRNTREIGESSKYLINLANIYYNQARTDEEKIDSLVTLGMFYYNFQKKKSFFKGKYLKKSKGCLRQALEMCGDNQNLTKMTNSLSGCLDGTKYFFEPRRFDVKAFVNRRTENGTKASIHALDIDPVVKNGHVRSYNSLFMSRISDQYKTKFKETIKNISVVGDDVYISTEGMPLEGQRWIRSVLSGLKVREILKSRVDINRNSFFVSLDGEKYFSYVKKLNENVTSKNLAKTRK